jgi:hypothetical protein
MNAPNSIFADLETAIQSGSVIKRGDAMKRVTDLFFSGVDHFNEDQIRLFDDVLLRLTKKVEIKALAELSGRLAPVSNAPIGVVKHLARHDDILVAAPILTQSERLTEADLIEIAKTKGQGHLSAISDRTTLNEQVTDVLLNHGNKKVFHKLAQNPGASFSRSGFATIVKHAEGDDGLAEKIGGRADIPPQLMKTLVLKATASVRNCLLASAPSESHAEIRRVLASVSDDVVQDAKANTRDYKAAQNLVLLMQKENKLNDDAFCYFAKMYAHDEIIAALALLCCVKIELIESVARGLHYGGLLVACKAADLKWPTVNIILTHRRRDHPIGAHELELAKAEFAKLSKQTAQRLLGFWQARPDIAAS